MESSLDLQSSVLLLSTEVFHLCNWEWRENDSGMMNFIESDYISKRLLRISKGRLRAECMGDKISDNHLVEKAELPLLAIQGKKIQIPN